MNELNVLTGHVLDSAFRIHTKLGPGLYESVYETILARDLAAKGLFVERQKSVSFDFEGLWFADAFRIDLFVEHTVAVEIKSVSALAAAHEKQLFTYVRLLDCPAVRKGAGPIKPETLKRTTTPTVPSKPPVPSV